MQNIQLSAKEILDKDFKSSMKGYNKDEVDQFLDIVIQDYEAFEERINELEKALEQSQQSTKAAGGASRSQRANPTPVSQDQTAPAGGTNYDILKRLSNLEKEVFGKKLYD
ncbi:DivIVA domain-containing protein [Alteribacillus persepolensis]|uniref:DivIVA domain-containing protein n=1 Tax=Alteribacillus persepolensis TaxID=568899 RepID=A0A1G7Z0K0_9BACI|nr:cell division regulator GpsB [Alteribacillus persepolensis]SDH02233.1 DivIVA domain-containing protein [Alteribacillus persepolensis]